jgi:hypothetical protein
LGSRAERCPGLFLHHLLRSTEVDLVQFSVDLYAEQQDRGSNVENEAQDNQPANAATGGAVIRTFAYVRRPTLPNPDYS